MKRKLALLLILTAVSSTARASIIDLDGISDGDPYGNSETVSWFNGHKPDDTI